MPMKSFFASLRKAMVQAFKHDVVNTSKAAAYSGMLMFFPAFLVMTLLLAGVPEGSTRIGEIRVALDQYLPEGSMYLLQSYVISRRMRIIQVIFSASALSLWAGLGVMLSFMEGFRRAYGLPQEDWGFWSRRLRALLLVPIALAPLSVVTIMVVFGHQIEVWMVNNARHEMRHIVVVFWRLVRWGVAVGTSLAVLTALYHFGTRRKEHWLWVGPGAVAGTLIWFPSTLAFGWYVTRIADYSMFYGSFGAGIAMLVWLYITSFSVLLGAELNGVLYGNRHSRYNL
jgi:membrane protein